jgi:hypothetical protein
MYGAVTRARLIGLLALAASACSGSIDPSPGAPGQKPGPASPGDPAGPDGNGGSGPGPSFPAPVPSPTCAASPLPAPRLWRLTHRQYENTVKDTFGFTVPALATLPQESRLDGFANASDRLAVSSVLLESYNRAAEQVAAEVLRRSGEFLKCAPAALGTGTCLAEFLDSVGRKAWRRPLTEAEVGKLRTLHTEATAAAGPEEGLKMVVQGLLLSANFLHRVELGDPPAAGATGGTIALTDYELASSLSYMLWDAPPDAALMDLAARGKLRDRATLLAQAQRLLVTAGKAPAALASFVQQWLETEDFTARPKDLATFPSYTPQLAQDLQDETALYLQELGLGGDHSLRTLLTARHGYVNQRTAGLYGLTAPAGDALVKTPLPPAQRRGLLTQASFLASHAEPSNTSVVNRGRFIREEILCSDVPPPPGDFQFNEKIITEDMTAREKFVEHSKNPSCAACHVLFDTIGFALENYDALGQWRTTEKGKTIDPSGALPLPSGGEIKFANFIDLIDQLAKAPDTYSCFSAQYLSYASGRGNLSDCEKETIAKSFTQSDYRLDALVAAIVASPSFMSRQD